MVDECAAGGGRTCRLYHYCSGIIIVFVLVLVCRYPILVL